MIVVGAGIVGAACAAELQAAGLRVLLLERDFAGGEATAAGMGHVVVMDDSPAQLALTAWSRRLWADLAPELPPDCEHDACGTLWLAQDDAELEHARGRARTYRDHGVEADVLDARALAEAEPRLRSGLAGALRVPADRVVYPPAVTRFLVTRLVARGGEWRAGAAVTSLGPRSVTCADGTRLEAGAVVLATGATAAGLLPGLPVEPRRGHLLITERVPGFCRHQLVEAGYLASAHGSGGASVAFNVQPRATGQLLIGSSREYVGLERRPDPAVRARVLRRAIEFLPDLAGVTILRTWVGFRPATPDKLPLIGRHAAFDGLWLATGHEGLGITTALGSARLLAEMMTGRAPSIDPRPFDPARELDATPHATGHAQPCRPRAASDAWPSSAAASPPTPRATFTLDGRDVDITAATVAACAWNAGVARLRTSLSGEARGPICAMGVCFECRVTLDGRPQQRACLAPATPGARVETEARAWGAPPSVARGATTVEVDVAVVGAGPAGVAAAASAAEAGARVLLLDEGLDAGGQIWRHAPAHAARLPRAARAWLTRLARSGARLVTQAGVIDARPGELLARSGDGTLRVFAAHTILATGARELFLPFPGWTLPRVIGVGAAQALAKSGASWRGRRVVVAGSGPLLLPVAATLRAAGARVVVVAEQARLLDVARFALRLVARPGKLLEGLVHRAGFSATRYRLACHVVAARGDDGVREVTLSDGRRAWSEACDVLACGFGLVPNTELARLLGCAVRGGAVEVDDEQRTSVPGVLAAGEVTGVGGAEAALAEGRLAGLVAAGSSPDGALRRARDDGRRFAAQLARAFAPRDELRALVRDDTLVCRCEDVPWGRLRAFDGAREAKLLARAGMGACQGRVCGAALAFLRGWDGDRVRPPLAPVEAADLAHED